MTEQRTEQVIVGYTCACGATKFYYYAIAVAAAIGRRREKVKTGETEKTDEKKIQETDTAYQA